MPERESARAREREREAEADAGSGAAKDRGTHTHTHTHTQRRKVMLAVVSPMIGAAAFANSRISPTDPVTVLRGVEARSPSLQVYAPYGYMCDLYMDVCVSYTWMYVCPIHGCTCVSVSYCPFRSWSYCPCRSRSFGVCKQDLLTWGFGLNPKPSTLKGGAGDGSSEESAGLRGIERD